ncbi:MAG: AI-2E family transporter [Armatimonadetes bacterium]|nr:AI-2E family transporter [Armatimonadota bacterium]MBS1712050.1 AI-2E family transporter [Armatimonadota bacterium]MBX3109396.1 AI-2E family transporter [Fimbriimonadaceae bacterium]
MHDFKSRNGFIIFWIVAIAVIGGVIYLVSPFLPAILWASVFSILLYPAFERLVAKGWKRGTAALAVTLVPAFVVTLPLAVAGSIAGVQVVSYAQQLLHDSGRGVGAETDVLRTLGDELDKTLKPLMDRVGATDIHMADVLDKNKAEIGRRISAPLSRGIQNFVFTVLTLVISLLTMFFMVRDGHNMKEPVLDLVPLPREDTEKILQQIANTVRSVFYSVVVVAGIQGGLALLLYWIVGVPGAIPLALLTTLFCTIPLLGAPVVYVPIGLSLLIQGKIWQGVLVLVIGFGLISTIDNVLRPLFIGARTKLHEIPVFFALIGGVVALGPVGLMAGPMLLTLFLALVDILRLRRDGDQSLEPA